MGYANGVRRALEAGVDVLLIVGPLTVALVVVICIIAVHREGL